MKRIPLCLAVLLTVLSANGAVLYVHPAPAGTDSDGLSWTTAFTTVTEALEHATAGDELWVAAGTYKGPVRIPPGVALYGGFAGNEAARTQRDWSRHNSVLDWQQWGDGLAELNERFGPAVALGMGSRLDGFTVLNGWHSHGAGVYAADSGALIANNIIVTNRSSGLLSSAVLVDRIGTINAGDDFFLRTANDLLRMQFSFGVTNIPIAQYGPAVHRLLQVAANLYDAARPNVFPTVFRPQFAAAPDGPIISGYYEDNSATNVNEWLATNPYGIPMIIGARKGMPNFNELVLETTVFVARRLELRRATTNSPPYQTNEMYIIGISNAAGVELWNSYTQAFGHDVQITIGNTWSCQLSTVAGLLVSTTSFTGVITNFPAGGWPGLTFPNSVHPANTSSFKTLFQRQVVLPLSAIGVNYIETPPTIFEANSGFQIPDWRMFTSNRLAVLVSSGGRVVDFVLLSVTNATPLSAFVFHDGSPALMEEAISACWRTNRPSANPYTPTEGIQAQLDFALGHQAASSSQWAGFNAEPHGDIGAAITNFAQFVYPRIYLSGNPNTNLIQIAPFSPARKIVITVRWEANDPFVHALPEHLKDLTNNFLVLMVKPFTSPPLTNQSLGTMNSRYGPWGGGPGLPRPEDFDWRIKDRGLWYSGHFDFPGSNEVNVDWLDRIHRGTPWQTLYFDRDVAPMNVWLRQLPDPATHPTNDWRIIDYLRDQLTYSGSPTPTRVVNNTVVGNDAALGITADASASVINNAVAYNTSGIFNEGGSNAEFSRNLMFANLTDNNAGDLAASPQFVDASAGDFSVLATSPLIDAGNDIALGWVERPIFGGEVDIGALEFGPTGIPVFALHRTSSAEYEWALHGFTGQSYVIEASTNLVDWAAISTNVASFSRTSLARITRSAFIAPK